MIHVIVSKDAGLTPRPAFVVSDTFAIPLYHKPWGVYSPIVEWREAGLQSPGFAILSQPHTKFVVRKRIGFLSYSDRMRLLRIANYIPEVKEKLDL